MQSANNKQVPAFTLVSTVFNEASRLNNSLEGIANQTVLPTEVIVTDAGSTDRTVEILRTWEQRVPFKVTVLVHKGCNIAQGRNLSIGQAKTDIIVSTDFGCLYSPDWLYFMVKPFENPEVRVTGGAYGVREDEISSLAARANYVLTDGYAVSLDENFIPSSRSIAYRKEAWQQVGKYPEWLTLAADDLVFGLKIKACGIPITLVPGAHVLWGRHTDAGAYFKESYRYGLGDGESGMNKRNFFSNLLQTFGRYAVVLNVLWLTPYAPSWYFWVPVWLLGLLGFRAYYGLFKNIKKHYSPKYHAGVGLMAWYMLEAHRIYGLRGYWHGLTRRTPAMKKGVATLNKILKDGC